MVETDFPSQEGKVMIVTGANAGVGKATALGLAEKGAHVFLACRSEAKALPVVQSIRAQTKNDNVEFLPLDLASFSSIRDCVKTFEARNLPLHVLVNNAGLLGQRGLTSDGFNLTFGVNHIGTFLLTNLLLKKLKESAPSRIVTVSSGIYNKFGPLNIDAVRLRDGADSSLRVYAQSKLANLLMTLELTKRLKGTGVTALAANPGVTHTDIFRDFGPLGMRFTRRVFKSATAGALPSLFCAMDPNLPKRPGTCIWPWAKEHIPSGVAKDERLAAELWKRSEQWTGLAK